MGAQGQILYCENTGWIGLQGPRDVLPAWSPGYLALSPASLQSLACIPPSLGRRPVIQSVTVPSAGKRTETQGFLEIWFWENRDPSCSSASVNLLSTSSHSNYCLLHQHSQGSSPLLRWLLFALNPELMRREVGPWLETGLSVVWGSPVLPLPTCGVLDKLSNLPVT